MQSLMLNQLYSMYDFGWCNLEMDAVESCLYLPESSMSAAWEGINHGFIIGNTKWDSILINVSGIIEKFNVYVTLAII